MSARGNEQRAAVVAALRELADLIEGDTSLPVPQHGRMQASVALCRPERERFAAVRAFADRFGLDVIETPRGSRSATKHFGPIRYFAIANADDYDGEARFLERVVPAEEDAALDSAGKAGALASVVARAADPDTVTWVVDPKGGAA